MQLHMLLWLEELQHEQDIAFYNLEGVTLDSHGNTFWLSVRTAIC
jgi:hypothetical protein